MKKSTKCWNGKIVMPDSFEFIDSTGDHNIPSNYLCLPFSISSHANLEFRSGGNGISCLRQGWSLPEDHFTWSTGVESEIVVPTGGGEGAFLLTISVAPFIVQHRHPQQRLQIIVNEKLAYNGHLTCAQTISVIIPPSAGLAASEMKIVFKHPDAVVVSDFVAANDHRKLAVALSSVRMNLIEPGLSPTALEIPYFEGAPSDRAVMLDFESLGDNCEFGLVQRRAGAEPFSLLRFSAVAPDTLLELLQTRFSQMANREKLQIEAVRLESGDEEYLVHHQFYNLTYHTFTLSSQMKADRVAHRELARLTLATRALLEHLQAADRIFIYRTHKELNEAHLLSLHVLLREYGPTTLLYVTTATADHPAGTVEVIADGLLRGYLGRFAPYDDAHAGDDQSWITLCGRAHAYWKLSRVAQSLTESHAEN